MSQLDDKERSCAELAEESNPSSSVSLPTSSVKPKRWKTVLMWLIVIVATPVTVTIGAVVGHRSYIIVSILVILYTMIPFFVQFERRKPQARELVVLAVMIAIAVASRVVFAFFPNFKPMVGIVIVTGIALGSSSGFLAGSLSALVSNFIFGQGPWTPWQMLTFGLAGFLFGFLADRGIIKRGSWSMKQRIAVSVGAGLFIAIFGTLLLNMSTIFWMLSRITPQTILAVYIAGLPMDAMHAAATFLTVLLIGNPILDKLGRIKIKYGLMK